MATINLWPYGPMQYTGEVATSDLFGTNFLYSRDGAWQPGQISQPYKAFASEVGLSIMRYPGGTMTEDTFDMENPNNTGNPLPGAKGLVPLSSFLEFASSIGASASIVIPTYRLYTSDFDAQGQRIIDPQSESKVRTFIRLTLEEAKAAGTEIKSFELGNEWWVDNTAIFGFRMSPVEYGRIANFLARTIQETISEHNLEQPSWDKVDPEIAIQVGPGGNAEWYTRAALGLPDIGTGPSITATEAIFLQITDPVSKSAIDATLTHRYLHGDDQSISGWQYSPFQYWDTLANQTPGFNTDVRRYVTEWNVSARNTSETGIKQFDTMVLLTQEMMNAGVDLAAAWAVQQNNSTKLTYNTGLKEADFAGLTFGGLAFDMMAAQLPGQRVVFNSGSLSGLQSVVFGSESRVVYFLTNKTGELRNDVIDRSTVAPGVTHVSIYEVDLGPDGKPTVNVRTYALTDLPTHVPLILSPDETAMIVLTKGGNGATIEGYDLADNLVGTVGPDSMFGGLKNDLMEGSGGDDTVLGEDGNDTISGSEGNDVLVGGGGDDLVYGGNGDDYIDGNFEADTIFGGAGIDTVNLADLTAAVRLDLTFASNLLPHLGISLYEIEGLVSGIGNDTIFGSSVGNSVDAGDGHDFLDGREGDDALTGGEGSDTIFGADGNDSLNGGRGMDDLFGGRGSDWVASGMGDDIIYGGSGDDVMESGEGNDSAFGDDGADVILGNAGDDSMFGGSGDDRIFGNSGSDVVSAGEGDDFADGGSGDDLIWGGAGSDSLFGREGDDLIFGDSPTTSEVWIFVTCTGLELSDAHLIFLGNDSGESALSGDSRLSGGMGNDSLIGGQGNDKVFGDDGDDLILGSAGVDFLWGGLGTDVFIFDPIVSQAATVVDFQSGIDRIALLGSLPDTSGSIAIFVDQAASVVPDGVLLTLDHDSSILFSDQKSLQFLYSSLEFIAI